MRRAMILATLFLGGCGEEVPEATPTGSIQGEIRDGTTRAPIAAASVVLWAGASERVTSANEQGRFFVEGVPAGSELLVDFEAAGYARARATVLVDDEAGEHPQANSIAQLDVQLFPNDHSVTVVVIDGETGDGVQGISVTGLPYIPDYYEEETPFFGDARLLDPLSGITGVDGEVVIEGVAAWQEYIFVSEANDTYGSESDDYTQGFDSNVVVLDVWDFAPDEPSCNESGGSCCDSGDPCDFANDDYCDCPACGWDATDCF